MIFPEAFYRWRPHPWHGLEVGPNPPEVVNAYIEMTPFDLVKYEVDKKTGYSKVDRPQRTSSQPPSLYGFIPRTYCGDRVAKLSPVGISDKDPLDICVLSERPISRADLIVRAQIVGGLPMIDEGEADDKIIAVLENDYILSGNEDISDLPEILVERLDHYFRTYKMIKGQKSDVSIGKPYGKKHARKVIQAAMEDYIEVFGG